MSGVVMVGGTWPLGGCATLHRNPVPDNVIAARQLSLRGIDAMERESWGEAEAYFANAIKTCPADERARRRYAQLMWRKGEADAAVAHLQKAVELSGGDPELLVELGEMHLARGQIELAWKQAEEAIQLQRQLASAWALRGDILQRQGRLDESIVSYLRALSCQPHYPDVQIAVAQAYHQQGRARRALSTLESLAADYPPDAVPQRVLYLQGLSLKALLRFDDAAETLALASQRGDASAELLFHLSEAQLQSGDAGSARLSARTALELAPHDAPLRELSARIDERQRRLTAAVERYEAPGTGSNF